MNPDAPIIYFNRLTGQEETEQVVGEKHLKRIYGTCVGKLALHLLLKRAFFSKMYGSHQNRAASRKDIEPFIKKYGINMNEAKLPASAFHNFNEFFYRELKPDARPINPDSRTAIFPADARHLGFRNISQAEGVFVKGQSFDLPSLLGSEELGRQYAEGTLIISRLCPTDYHRFHFPVEGVPGETRQIDGPLASVSPYALRRKLSWLWTNKRTVTLLQSETWGQVALIDVGATCVGSIIQTYSPGQPVEKGAEKGYFAFGGSTVITLFEPGRIRLCDDLEENTSRNRELYSPMGTPLGYSTR